MTRTATIAAIAGLSLLLTPVVVGATGSGRQVAAPAAAPAAPVVADASAGPAPAPRATEPGCRRVKVIYAGYGEAGRAPCPPLAPEARR